VSKRLGMRRTFALGALGSVPCVIVLPFLNALVVEDSAVPVNMRWPSLWAMLALHTFIFGFFSSCAFSSGTRTRYLERFSQSLVGLTAHRWMGAVMAMIANSVHYNLMGAANGLGQSLVALLRAIGPVMAGPVPFGFSLLEWFTTDWRDCSSSHGR
jgi:hypothetical protein